jgi:L-galactono-1,4-lactone dehydrogenase
MADLLLSLDPALDPTHTNQLSFSQLRDQLLDLNPLDLAHIKKVNEAEAKFWRASQGKRLGDSTDILGFDCGGEQLVMEFCFPIGTLRDTEGGSTSTCVTEGKDLQFVSKLLALIEKAGIPAPSPIEQRWTASSSALMSPAYAVQSDGEEIFSWVGVIMYLPPNQTEHQRVAIKARFSEYLELIQPLLEEYNAHAHWAKIEIPVCASSTASDVTPQAGDNSWYDFFAGQKAVAPLSFEDKMDTLRFRLASRYPIKEFNAYRSALDPHNILSNRLVDELISPKEEE